MTQLPQVRAAPWYPGQMGVPGSDVQRGFRWSPTAIVLYVDENHPNATAVADGTDPENPLNSIQQAVNRLISFQTAMAPVSLVGSVIVVGAGATITESVIIPPTAPLGCTILGMGANVHSPTWTAATAAGTALTVRREYWTIEGFEFRTGTAGTAIGLELTAGGYNALGTTIRNCFFWGQWNGLYGINFVGAPHRVTIEHCEFMEYRRANGTAYAIVVSDAALVNPYECHVNYNVFWENENHVGPTTPDRSFNMSTFIGNVFHRGVLIPSTLQLDLRGGSRGQNIVTQNVFYGDYSNAGGYWAHAANSDMWAGNFTDDWAEPEVGPDGITIKPPV